MKEGQKESGEWNSLWLAKSDTVFPSFRKTPTETGKDEKYSTILTIKRDRWHLASEMFQQNQEKFTQISNGACLRKEKDTSCLLPMSFPKLKVSCKEVLCLLPFFRGSDRHPGSLFLLALPSFPLHFYRCSGLGCSVKVERMGSDLPLSEDPAWYLMWSPAVFPKLPPFQMWKTSHWND